jgi:hypothetical protein
VLIPVEVDVESDETLLFVVDRPVDSEVTPDCAVLIPVDVDVDSDVTPTTTALSCEPLMASVLVAEITPAPTFWI